MKKIIIGDGSRSRRFVFPSQEIVVYQTYSFCGRAFAKTIGRAKTFRRLKKRQIIKKLSIPGKPSEQKPMLQRLRQLFAPIFNNSVKMDFSEVKQGLEAGSILLIDVRNPDEVRNLGKIPGSHNIPCK